MRFEAFELDPGRRALLRDGAPVVLSPKAFDVLAYLVGNPARVVTKDELLKAVWPGAFVEEGNLAQHISSVRKALGDRSGLIVTVPGRGYQFTAVVERVPTAADLAALEAGDVVLQRVRERMRVRVEETIEEPIGVPERARVPLGLAGPARKRVLAGWPAYCAAGLLAVAVMGGVAWKKRHAVIPDHHHVVLADFENKTEDPAFDRVLNRAFKINLEQSPYIDVMSERDAGETLKLMGRSGDAAIDASVARELCIRANRQVLLAGTIYRLGNTYLMTVEATDCVSGKQLASAKGEAASKGQVPAAVDRVAEKIRSALGESAESLQRYQVPIAEATTSSLEALTYYSEGMYLDSGQTRSANVRPLYLKAIEIDPNFAMAYAALAEEYRRLGETDTAARYFKQAFELRMHVSAHEKLILEAQYYSAGIGDIPQALEAYHLWASTFPYDSMARAEPIRLYLELGQYSNAIEAGEAAIKADPQNPFSYQRLTLAYMGANRFADAKAVIAEAERVHRDSTTLHRFNYELALLQQDEAAAAKELARPIPIGSASYGMDYVRGLAAVSAGRYGEAHGHFVHADNELVVEKLPEVLANFLTGEAVSEARLGLIDGARATMAQIQEPEQDSADYLAMQVELGQTAEAARYVAAHASDVGTLMRYAYLPRIRAELALRRGKPLEAIAALEPARPYELRDYEVPSLRGEAYLRAGQPEQAIKEYQKVLANPGIGPVSVLYPLAHLGMARAEAMRHDPAASRRECEALLAQWKDADADLPVVRQARAEYAALR